MCIIPSCNQTWLSVWKTFHMVRGCTSQACKACSWLPEGIIQCSVDIQQYSYLIIPDDNQTWLAGKSTISRWFSIKTFNKLPFIGDFQLLCLITRGYHHFSWLNHPFTCILSPGAARGKPQKSQDSLWRTSEKKFGMLKSSSCTKGATSWSITNAVQ